MKITDVDDKVIDLRKIFYDNASELTMRISTVFCVLKKWVHSGNFEQNVCQHFEAQIIYIRSFQSFDRTLLEVIGGQESESEVRFSIRPPHWLECRPIRNELFYIRSFQSFDRTLLEVIGGQETISEVGLWTPLETWPIRNERFYCEIFEVLIKLYYKLSENRSQNRRLDFGSTLEFRPISNELFYQKAFGRFDET
jgi:hypothetical protein